LVSNVFQASIRAGFRRAYNGVQVDPQKYLQQFRRANRLPIQTWSDMFSIEEKVVNHHAARVVKSAMRAAAFEGAGLGLGGMLTILPDAGILSAITIRMLQKLSLIYGFEYKTEEEVTELWVAAASAAGLDLGREFIEKQAMEKIVPRIIDRIAVRVGAEVAEKWSGRLIPLLGAASAKAFPGAASRGSGARFACVEPFESSVATPPAHGQLIAVQGSSQRTFLRAPRSCPISISVTSFGTWLAVAWRK